MNKCLLFNLIRNLIIERLLLSLRYIYWKIFFNKLGKNVRFYGCIKVLNPSNISVGDNCAFNDYVLLNARKELCIGNNVVFSSGATVHTTGLVYDNSQRTHLDKKVLIEDGVWIGSNATVLSGVTIGKNSVIGAGSVVTKNVPPNSVAVGVPAKIIKSIDFSSQTEDYCNRVQ